MLSNHERRELARIERGLREDPEWREPQDLPGRTPWWRRCGLQLLVGFAGLVTVIGVVTTDGPLLLEGVLLMGAACVWWLGRQMVAARAESRPPEEPER